MPTVDATTFRRDFGRYQDEAQREPAKVTSHGRLVGVFLSSHDLEHYENLKRRETKALHRFTRRSESSNRSTDQGFFEVSTP